MRGRPGARPAGSPNCYHGELIIFRCRFNPGLNKMLNLAGGPDSIFRAMPELIKASKMMSPESILTIGSLSTSIDPFHTAGKWTSFCFLPLMEKLAKGRASPLHWRLTAEGDLRKAQKKQANNKANTLRRRLTTEGDLPLSLQKMRGKAQEKRA